MKRVLALSIAALLLAGLFGVQGGAAQPAAASSATEIYPPLVSIWNNVELRKAVSYCTDKAALVQSVYTLLSPAQVAGLVRDSFVSPVSWAYKSPATLYPYNPAAGQAILATQGWLLAPGDTYRKNAQGKELVVEVTSTTAQFRKTYLAVFEAQMAACGIHVVRSHAPSIWFFGDTTGLARRDYELGVFAWVSPNNPGDVAYSVYSCDRIPTPRNGWAGQNNMGWCNTTADDAIKTAVNTFDKTVQQAQLATVQDAFGADVPSLPLFARMNIHAYNQNLTGFAAFEGDDYYASKAYQWARTGRTTLYWGKSWLPYTLFSVDSNSDPYILATMGLSYTTPNYNPTPMLQSTFSSIGSGATNATVSVSAGQKIYDVGGYVKTLAPGVKVRDASGNVITYAGGTVSMKQLTVDYTFRSGLTWNDGTVVSQADFQLGYNIACSPAVYYSSYALYCELAHQFSANAHGYQVTWIPGYQEQNFYLAPFPYFPGHRPIQTPGPHFGKTLAQVPAYDWENLIEVVNLPWSAGPYYVSSYIPDVYIELSANPHSVLGAPATAAIRVVRSDNPEAALIADTVDIVGSDSLPNGLTSALNNATNVTKVILPSATWEHLDFNFNIFPKVFLPVIGR